MNPRGLKIYPLWTYLHCSIISPLNQYSIQVRYRKAQAADWQILSMMCFWYVGLNLPCINWNVCRFSAEINCWSPIFYTHGIQTSRDVFPFSLQDERLLLGNFLWFNFKTTDKSISYIGRIFIMLGQQNVWPFQKKFRDQQQRSRFGIIRGRGKVSISTLKGISEPNEISWQSFQVTNEIQCYSMHLYFVDALVQLSHATWTQVSL